MTRELDSVAELFRALGSVSRLSILLALRDGRATVTTLVGSTGMSQPLVSQHLRSLREVGLVSVERLGRESHYSVADRHVQHIVEDAMTHASETAGENDSQ
ncbi:ArsR/SmtB family transcription factor [Pseudolysinimonas sp.]|jgi:DNA-binding transcriptional ArsR family regulator|uniref:ArsR/SmtB family transcription factor n=1 Tax=Pseudolysinimonas sp. TaxID=2680009 RepID=UPI0037832D81